MRSREIGVWLNAFISWWGAMHGAHIELDSLHWQNARQGLSKKRWVHVAHGLRIGSTMTGKPWCRESEVPDHIATTVRNRKRWIVSSLSVLLILNNPGNGTVTSVMGLPISINLRTSLQVCWRIHFHGDSKFFHVGNEDSRSFTVLCTLETNLLFTIILSEHCKEGKWDPGMRKKD